MRVQTFEQFAHNQRVRYISEFPQFEPVGTITEIEHTSQHVTISWDDEHPPSKMDALSAIRKLEIL